MGWLEEIEQRWAAATPGPWTVNEDKNEQPNIYSDDGHWIALLPHQCVASLQQQARMDAQAIASAPSDIARLVAEVKRYQKLETAVRDWKRGSFTGEQDIDDALAALDEGEVRG